MKLKLTIRPKFCPNCKGKSIKKFEFGEFWCPECRHWFTRTDYKRAEEPIAKEEPIQEILH
ncbi:hypothetical protein ACFL1B_05045 [Nanoarchaeota archaeon]